MKVSLVTSQRMYASRTMLDIYHKGRKVIDTQRIEDVFILTYDDLKLDFLTDKDLDDYVKLLDTALACDWSSYLPRIQINNFFCIDCRQ